MRLALRLRAQYSKSMLGSRSLKRVGVALLGYALVGLLVIPILPLVAIFWFVR